jgi:uncharacterized protein (TIGR00251 family)
MNVEVHVKVNAKKTEFVEIKNGIIIIKLKESPVEGQANKELIDFISKSLGIKKTSIKILMGKKSKKKVLKIDGAYTWEEMCNRLKQSN